MKWDRFISYSSADRHLAEPLVKLLARHATRLQNWIGFVVTEPFRKRGQDPAARAEVVDFAHCGRETFGCAQMSTALFLKSQAEIQSP